MRRWFAVFPVAAAVAAGLLILPASAVPATNEKSIIQDDTLLLYSGPQREVKTLETLHALGVDVVKVTMGWWLIAPDAQSHQRPTNFDATNPAAYDPVAWQRYDLLVKEAKQLGMKVYFQLAPPEPIWAAEPGISHKQGISWAQMPKPQWFQQFVQAVGTRYSGTYHPDSSSPALPRVSWWGIWNEPNYPAWLAPWHVKIGGVRVRAAAPLYREIVNAAYRGLAVTGHGSDTILIGETANRGTAWPIPFIEHMYCVGPNYHQLFGQAAANVGCPRTASRSKFKQQNPGLFHIAGYAHHPYQFTGSPGRPLAGSPQWVTIYNLQWLESVLNHIFSSYGNSRSGGTPIYVTEWGLITHPPHPKGGAYSLSQAAVFMNQAEYLTWRDRYVKAMSQYLLKDDKGNLFSSGLEYINGKPKPLLPAFRLPIWLPVAKHGTNVAVWGELRPAEHQAAKVGVIQFRSRGSSSWVPVDTVNTQSSEGFFLVHVMLPGAGTVRLQWTNSSGTAYYSRLVPVS